MLRLRLLSFIKDIGTFNNFDDVVCVNSEDKDWKKQVNENLKDDKTVMVFVSLCYSTKRNDRLSFLMNKKMNKHLIVDEARLWFQLTQKNNHLY